MKRTFNILFCFLSTFAYSQNWVSLGGGSDFPVRNIFIDSNNNLLYAIGQFQNIGGISASKVAYWDGLSWTSVCNPPFVLDGNPILYGTFYNNELYVSGTQNVMGDVITGTMSHYLGSMNWESFGNPNGYNSLEVVENKLIAYRSFDSIGGKNIKNIAVWDGISWEPFGDSSVLNNVNITFLSDIETYNSKYILGGNIDSPPFKELIQWDGISWSALGTGIPGNSWVNCMKTYKGILYIGGYFDEPDFPSFLVAWDGQSFFKPFENVNFLGQIWDLQIIDNDLYILGPLELNMPNISYGLAKFDGDSLCVFGGSGIWGTPLETPGAMKITKYDNEIIVVANKKMLQDTVNYIGKWTGVNMDTCIYSPVHLGLTEFTEDERIYLFPNPCNDLIEIKSSNYQMISKIRLLNYNGEIISELEINEIEKIISTKMLSNSIYFLDIELSNGTCVKKRFIKGD